MASQGEYKWGKRKLLLWLLLFSVLLFLVAGVAMLFLDKYAKTGRCYRNGSMLSADELRMRVIRNLLAAEMASSAWENKYKIYVRTFLIRRSLTASDVIDAIASKSIVDIQKEAVYPLNTYSEVANVDAEFLRGEFSIVRYGFGYVDIIPSQSLKAVDGLDEKLAQWIGLTLFERVFGYGNNYFQVEKYSRINLNCCTDIYNKYQKAKCQAWCPSEIIGDILAGKRPVYRYLVVSNCGYILHRWIDDQTGSRHLF